MTPQLVDHSHTDSRIVIGCNLLCLYLVAVTSQLHHSRSRNCEQRLSRTTKYRVAISAVAIARFANTATQPATFNKHRPEMLAVIRNEIVFALSSSCTRGAQKRET